MKKALALLLVAVILLPCLLAGCDETKPIDPWLGNLNYNGDGITEDNVVKRAHVITGKSEAEKYAGEELTKYLIAKNVEIADDGFPIIIFTGAIRLKNGLL
jgi:outer membrane murein-binding lipoprotein Lpp